MKKLLPIVFLFLATTAYSQKFTQADVAGKYLIKQIYVDDTIMVDYTSEKAFTDLYIKQMYDYMHKNPGKAPIDTAGTHADAKSAYIKGGQLTISFENSGYVLMSNPMGGADTTASWTFDADKQRITFLENSYNGQFIVPQWVGKTLHMTILGNNDPRNRVMIVKE
jgi:hypothetical protein